MNNTIMNKNLNIQIREHSYLMQMLSDALYRAKNAKTNNEYWDCIYEINLIQAEIKDTEKVIANIGVEKWN